MALQGNLKELRLGDVLQTVLSAGNRGVFRVRSAGRRAVMHLGTDGLRLLEPEVLSDRLILEALLQRGTLGLEALDRARGVAGPRGSPLETLLAGGSVDAASVDALLADAVEDNVLDVLSWTDGHFRFEEGVDPEAPRGRGASITLDPAGILLRAAQRMDERRKIVDILGENVRLVLPAESHGVDVGGLEAPAADVLGRLDGHRMLDEIALTIGSTLFVVQKATAALVEARAARLPRAEELAERAAQREKADDLRAAFSLLQQWQASCPSDPKPYEATAELAARTARPEDEAEALRALGHLRLRAAEPVEARATFEKVLERRPGDRDALDGLRQAARASGDLEAFAKTSHELAVLHMQAEDFGLASALLHEVLLTAPEDFDVRLLRTKALVRLGDRVQALEEFERLAGHLPNPCKRRAERDAVSWCRDTITHLAPERSDLLRAFRERLESGQPRRKRALILTGLLLAVAGTGVAFWPKPASSLLARAKDASERGDTSTALALVRELEEKHADSPQYAEASALRARIESGSQGVSRRVDAAAVNLILAAADRTAASLPEWPDPKALSEAEALIDLLRTPDAASDKVRKEVTSRLRLPFADAVASLRREATDRRDALDRAPQAAAKPPPDLETFRAVVERAKTALDPLWSASAQRAAAIARRLGSLLLETNLTAGLSGDLLGVDSDVEALGRAVAARPRDVDRARRELHRATVVDAYERARLEAVKILVRGDLDGAEACYARLGKLLAEVESDPVLRPLKEPLEKRGILDFARSRAEMLRNIRDGLKAAHEAEASGNLSGAATSYAQLAAQFPQIRFDSVFSIPVRILTTPPTARVSLNGQSFLSDGKGSTVLRYGWGAPATVSVTAAGFETTALVLKTADPHPEGEIHVRLAPARRWTRPLVGVVEASPLGIDGDVILCNRSGRVERRSKETGDVLWATDLRSIEGIRGRPAYDRGVIWIALVEGRVARVFADLGTTLPELPLRSRPIGDVASLPGRVAFALDDVVAIFTDGQSTPTYVSIRSTVTAGVISAHGAFWVGDAAGGVTRIDGSTLTAKALSSGGADPIVGLCGGEEAVYALGGDGTLYAVESRAAQTILWKRPGLGDVAGSPAEAEGIVGVADRSGRVRLLEAKTGAARGEEVLGSPTQGGLVSIKGRLVATLANGRVWVYAPRSDIVLVDAPFGGTTPLPPVHLGDGTIAVPAEGHGIAAFPLPR